MRRAYLSLGYSLRKHLQPEIDVLEELLAAHNIELFVFVDRYRFTAAGSVQMMQQAFADIEASDLLIAEVSEKAIGVGIEIGYAAALRKPVVYLRRSGTEHSTTVAGSAQHAIVYENTTDLRRQMDGIFRSAGF